MKKNSILWLIWLFEGILVGFGAILPGISGGTLLVAFGMYRPIIECISHLKTGFKKYSLMLAIFVLGVGIGFIGLSGLTAQMLARNTALVTCAFIGFILGTIPELWNDAGSKGRHKSSYLSMVLSFIFMLTLLTLLKITPSISVNANTAGYILCGILWGLSFIVPGLSSSSVLLFFGLYEPMLNGISLLDFNVLIPMGLSMAACVLLLSRVIGLAYQRQYSIVSHIVLGIVVATAVRILPPCSKTPTGITVYLVLIIGGFLISYCFTCLCNYLKVKMEES